MTTTFLLVLLLQSLPTTSEVAWMEPAAFHLKIGQTRAQVEASFARRGWKLAEEGETLVHEYANGKTVVLEFRDDRVRSIRFELVTFIPRQTAEWSEVRDRLLALHSKPVVESDSVMVFREKDLEIHAVLQDDPDSEIGKQQAAMIIVRYFDRPRAGT